MKIATIDIGTNTILLLLCEIDEGEVKIIEDYHKIARLGEGVDSTGVISNNAISRASTILEFYFSEIKRYDIKNVRAVATSAMRDAENGNLVRENLSKIINTEIQIIEGKNEAKLSFLGSSENKRSLVIDIGGGSTEIIAGEKDKIDLFESLNIGAVRLTERFSLNDKSNVNINNAQDFILSQFKSIKINTNYQPIAVAGTPNTLAMIHLGLQEYSREKLHCYNLELNSIKEVKDLIIKTSSNQLVSDYHVHQNRADIILGGTLILEQFLVNFDFSSILVSGNGLRFGLAIDFFNNTSLNE